ncbi:hypothetical protein GCM10010123_22650 [Pilimelia anulata]|uniref:Uncharacterized protein n=1 Tax=Pilimelia anulata TaxID=53371 RepID=A0A8J3BBE7_9ACTN|nr:hypothetical protein GCM10010123_22650 [Pilimelia anulata]
MALSEARMTRACAPVGGMAALHAHCIGYLPPRPEARYVECACPCHDGRPRNRLAQDRVIRYRERSPRGWTP